MRGDAALAIRPIARKDRQLDHVAGLALRDMRFSVDGHDRQAVIKPIELRINVVRAPPPLQRICIGDPNPKVTGDRLYDRTLHNERCHRVILAARYFLVFPLRRFQLYHNPVAPTAAPASKSHVINAIFILR